MTVIHRRSLLRTGLNTLDMSAACDTILGWAQARTSKFCCLANVHTVMEAWDDGVFRRQINGADLVITDGMPLVWALRCLGSSSGQRIRGPDLMLELCRRAEAGGIAIGLFGGTEDGAPLLNAFLARKYPRLRVAVSIVPPFRPITAQEDAEYCKRLSASGAKILFVGLGCPKQEKWIAAHVGRLPMVMLGVGAAFDLYSGRTQPAPHWMQRVGLEWIYRLVTEPRRLAGRYIKHNPRFVVLAGVQVLTSLLGVRLFEAH